ncbi:MAG: TadE/TadG family type IV pilus assembly protein [Thermodesulfobacteriota bacterium]
MTRDAETKKWGSNENGAAAVEFAIIVVLLLIIIFGILEFSFIFYQRHFIENAAREGMRIGIRANNYSCFDGAPAADCTASVDRKIVVEQKVIDYLSSLYQPANIFPVDVERVDATKSLNVTAEVNNFFPQLLSALVPGFTNQTTLSYSITGMYEDPDEYDNEE